MTSNSGVSNVSFHGGFRPAYNVQVVSAAGEQIVIAVDVGSNGGMVVVAAFAATAGVPGMTWLLRVSRYFRCWSPPRSVLSATANSPGAPTANCSNTQHRNTLEYAAQRLCE